MSRFERTQGRFAVAWGLDHETGPYVQVWQAPIDDQDAALVIIDNLGARVAPGCALRLAKLGLPAGEHERLGLLLRETKLRFRMAGEGGNPRPNIDWQLAADLFVLFGFVGMERELHEAFD